MPTIVDFFQQTYKEKDEHYSDGLDKFRRYTFDHPKKTEFLDCSTKL